MIKKISSSNTPAKNIDEVKDILNEKFFLKRIEKEKAHQKLISDCKLYLRKLGWNSFDDNCINDLVRVLEKYNITSKEQVCAFLAECTYETGSGKSLSETKTPDECIACGYEYEYRGAGYIQLTFKYAYECFATYLILRKHPELRKFGTFINPAHNDNYALMNEMYLNIVKGAQELNINISEYTAIVDVGTDYVAQNFAWESAGYFWYTKGLNKIAKPGMIMDDISSKVLGKDNGSYAVRSSYFEMIYDNEPDK